MTVDGFSTLSLRFGYRQVPVSLFVVVSLCWNRFGSRPLLMLS